MKKVILSILLLYCISIGLLGCKQQQEIVPPQQQKTNEALTEQDIKDIKEDFLNQKIADMTLEQKVGQLFFCAFRRDDKNIPITVWNEDIEKTIQQYHIGGVVLFGENIDTEQQTKQLIAEYRNHSNIPLLIGVDEEGGRVSRLHSSGNLKVKDIPPAKIIGDSNDTNTAYEAGKTIGSELKELGFDVDFAPVADVNTNEKNTVIGDRAYSSDAQIVAEMATAFIKGLHENGISACVKHFPGHGDTIEDSHNGIAVAYHTLEEMEKIEWLPFQKAIQQNVDFVMAGHITTPNATTDGLPASLSYEMLTEQLRNKLQFKGIIITDALDMGAVTEYNQQDTSLKAIEAGADMVLMPFELEKSYYTVYNAVKKGTLSEQELNEKVKRILSLKYDKGYFQ
ncbi:beta-N-acetylhexosaminidase [Clostridium sp. MD294]|uniref:beta-N-acetylhexosaminidase n=1 Tax=Clostridium sp. MD294 TaxID=97138 RepID=UPI0002CC7477|nr:beta-N-acetylhexosaminidase [Clostridium sp. MD294]NDO46190.1 beta-N-acetylhexosaminidase [Clostridium sp. MD294]USF30143.1 Beta-hexosaminidase [Clostridium sp. MD294]